ncbi:MAG: TraR/DksA family transcriptional regulator [Steroidobacteraceae bacterium]|nr:TraR/DksA family transcriptional regulator [Steroidobacteraceae bacterium]
MTARRGARTAREKPAPGIAPGLHPGGAGAARAALERRKAELEERLARVHRDLVHAEVPLEHDFAEQAVQRENEEVLAHLESHTRLELVRIGRALARADRGEYGVCESCGEAIDPARLAVVPEADRCVRCAGPG